MNSTMLATSDVPTPWPKRQQQAQSVKLNRLPYA